MYPVIDCIATGKRLRLIMKIRGVSIKQLQQYLGLACVQSIYHWLDGTNMPSIDHLYAMSCLLRVPLDNIVCGNKKSHRRERDFEVGFRLWSYYYLLQKAS
ncbi:MAG: helix-turn-helix transcriptional regulator [Lachnospiraceae bacterium]|nr:helix-turn-helix transcriptional regulator [Lachnospiraceae bacterium]